MNEYAPIKIPANRAAFYEVAYQEAIRGLSQQASVLDSLHTRAGLLLTAANVVTALFAVEAITDRSITPGGGVAIALYLLSMGLAIYVLLPRTVWVFAWDAQKVTGIIEGDEEPNLAELHRMMAWRSERAWRGNAEHLRRLFNAFKYGCVALGGEVVLWVLVLSNVNVCGVAL